MTNILKLTAITALMMASLPLVSHAETDHNINDESVRWNRHGFYSNNLWEHHHLHHNHHMHTATPIKHVIVIYQENVSFDHYFATYPKALNPDGEPHFTARRGTPSVNGLSEAMLRHNPNIANPQRLGRDEALTCDQDHHYGDEQRAFDGGLMDKFVEYTNKESCSFPEISKPNLVMDYYDGNTVTALWNYAQHFAMSDNAYNTTFGPSTPGALNLVSGICLTRL